MSRLITGSAIAALLAASPALAQGTDCQLLLRDPAATTAAARAIDADGDGRMTEAEYNACLDRAAVPADQRQSFIDQFAFFDNDMDKVVTLAELERGGAPAGAGTVAVEQAAPQVNVQQAAPEVSVTQPEPQIEVQQGEPQVAIQQAAPQVAIDAPPPEVEVRQAQPDVQVEQREPIVRVEQPEPEVRVEAAQPIVELQAEPPKVVVNQAEPEITIENAGPAPAAGGPTPPAAPAAAAPADAGATPPTDAAAAQAAPPVAATAEAETGTPPAAEAAQAPAPEPAPAQPTAQSALSTGVPVDQLEGETAFNSAGEEIGELTSVVREKASGRLFVVVSAGGFLGIGDTDVVFPYESVGKVDDRVVVDTALTRETVEQRQDYDADAYEDAPEPAAQ